MKKENKKDWQKIKEQCETQEDTNAQTSEEFEETVESEPSITYPELQERLAIAEKKAEENWQKVLRVTAESDNLHRKLEKEKKDSLQYGLQKLLTSLLPVVDSLEQALQTADKDTHSSMIEGVKLTLKLFQDTLAKNDVYPINPQGQPFNPQEQEAMVMQQSNELEPGTVLEVIQKGYKLHDRLLRAALVIVAKA